MKHTYIRPQVAVIEPMDDLLGKLKVGTDGGDPGVGRAKQFNEYSVDDAEDVGDDPWKTASLWDE